jgi:4-oxalocrotonate tautomerase
MPFIHIRSYSGRSLEDKQKAAQAIIKAASETMGAPEAAFTVAFEDVEREDWDSKVAQEIIEPLRDLLIVEHGALV